MRVFGGFESKTEKKRSWLFIFDLDFFSENLKKEKKFRRDGVFYLLKKKKKRERDSRMPLFSRSDSGASLFSISHLRQKMGQGDFSPKAKSPSPKARAKGDDLPPFSFNWIPNL